MKSLSRKFIFLLFCILPLVSHANSFTEIEGDYQISNKLVCRGMNESMMEMHNRNFGEDLGYIYMETCIHDTSFFNEDIDVMGLTRFSIIKDSNGILKINLYFREVIKSWNIINESIPSNWEGNPPLLKYGKFSSSHYDTRYYWSGFYGLLGKVFFEVQIFADENLIVIETEPRGGLRKSVRAKFKYSKL